MPHMTITEGGYKAVQAARRSGTRIQPDTFQVGTSNSAPPFASDNGLNGVDWYEGAISECHVLNNDTAIFVCVVPSDSPEAVAGELCLFLSGEAFAVGVLEKAYQKTGSFYLRLMAFVQADGIGEAINHNYATGSPLPKFGAYELVGTPDEAGHETLGVLDGHTSSGAERGPSLIVKSSLIDSEARWMSVNGAPVFKGLPSVPPSGTNLVLPYNAAGNDLVFVQIVGGEGVGQIRSVTYSSVSGEYTVGRAWDTAPNEESEFELWANVGTGAGRKNNSCTYPPVFDEDDAIGALVPPPELCQPQAPTPRTKPVTPVRVPTPPPVVTTPVSGLPRGVHFSGRPFADPFSESDVTSNALENLKQRLVNIHPSRGLWVWENWFKKGWGRYYGNAPSVVRPFVTEDAQRYKNEPVPYSSTAQLLEESAKSTPVHGIGPNGEQSTIVYCSNYLLAGDYPNFGQLRNTYGTTLDGIAVPPGIRLIIYSKGDFNGDKVLDVEGPIILCSMSLYQEQLSGGRGNGVDRLSPAVPVIGVDFLNRDEVWQGPSRNIWPSNVRFFIDEDLKTLDGRPQETAKVDRQFVNMSYWNGSLRIIDLALTGGG